MGTIFYILAWLITLLQNPVILLVAIIAIVALGCLMQVGAREA